MFHLPVTRVEKFGKHHRVLSKVVGFGIFEDNIPGTSL